MPYKVVLNLKGDFIPIEVFAQAIEKLKEILAELDVSISGKERIKWGVNRLRKGSAILEATPRVMKDPEYDRSAIIIPAFVNGIKVVSKSAVRPEWFTDEALDVTKDLAMLRDENVDKISITGSINGRTPRAIPLTTKIVSHIEKVIGPRFSTRSSVEGKLETISVHKTPRLTVYHSLTGKAVRCTFHREIIEEVKSALGKRVIASGIVYYDEKNNPTKVNLEHLRVLGDEVLPTTDELTGYFDYSDNDITIDEFLGSSRGG